MLLQLQIPQVAKRDAARKVVEDFEVIVSSEAPSSEGIRCRVESSEDPNVIPGASEWLENLEEEHKQCSLCGENQGSKVFLASADSDLVIKREDTEKYRIFFHPEGTLPAFKVPYPGL